MRGQTLEDNVQRAGADLFVHHRDEAAMTLEIDRPVETGVKAEDAGFDLVPDAEQAVHPG
jgi:hypothetical protein